MFNSVMYMKTKLYCLGIYGYFAFFFKLIYHKPNYGHFFFRKTKKYIYYINTKRNIEYGKF